MADMLDKVSGSSGLGTSIFDFLDDGAYDSANGINSAAATKYEAKVNDGYKDFVTGQMNDSDSWLSKKANQVALGGGSGFATREDTDTANEADDESAISNEEQTANDIGISESDSDFSWITLPEDEDNDDDVKSEDDSDTKKETSQYPNGISQDEFNAMYEYALGMTGRGGNQILDDYGDKTGFWGDFETIPLIIEDMQIEIQDLQAQYNTLKKRGTLSETIDNNIQRKIAENEAMVTQAQKQLDTLNAFIDNYASLYAPIEKEEPKNQAAIDKVNAAEKEYEQAYQSQVTAWGELTQALIEAGMDYNLTAEEILSSTTSKFELSKEAKNYASKAAEAIVKSMTQRDFKGDNFALPVDTSAKEYGSYLIQTAPSKAGVGISTYNVRVVSPKGDVIATGTIGTPNGWANGFWDIKDAKGNTVANGESTSTFAQSVTKALSNVAIVDYENSKSTSSVPEEVRSAAQAVLDAQNNLADKEEKLAAAQREKVNATHAAATESKQDIIDRYARGEINAYQAAVALSNIKDSMLDFNYNRITSDINYDNFKDSSKIAGDTGKGTVGISSLISDLQPVGRDNPASETNISSDITMEFKTFNEVKNAIDKVSTDVKDRMNAGSELSNIAENLQVFANNTFRDQVKEMMEAGHSLQEIRKTKQFKEFSQELFNVSQRLYDKVSAVEASTAGYGLNDLSKKDINKNLETITENIDTLAGTQGRSIGTYYSPGSDMQGIQGTGLTLDKEEVKALADYSKSIQATKDAAIALMKSAAFNGATNSQGGQYSEEWKSEMAEPKLKAKDYIAASAKGTLGVTATVLGAALLPVNPLVGTLLMMSGIRTGASAGLTTTMKEVRSRSSNVETLFENSDSKSRNVFNDIYNRGFEKANFGDIKSVGTYTNTIGGFVQMISGLASLSSGNLIAAIPLIREGVESYKKGIQGGLSNNLDRAIYNVYDLSENILEWSKLDLDIQNYMKDPDSYYKLYDTSRGESFDSVPTRVNRTAESNYGTEDNAPNVESKYQGAVEQAKNSNLATDYNAGMEQETNEAVSDKYVKVFKVMIDKEPDYIRKVLIAIPKNHNEREW